jgi:hypothetical protein
MNRIYQGNVTAVEIHGGKDEHGKLKWEKLASLAAPRTFQDAVNFN